MLTLTAICPECERVFDLTDERDADEWAYGHDCEATDRLHHGVLIGIDAQPGSGIALVTFEDEQGRRCVAKAEAGPFMRFVSDSGITPGTPVVYTEDDFGILNSIGFAE